MFLKVIKYIAINLIYIIIENFYLTPVKAGTALRTLGITRAEVNTDAFFFGARPDASFIIIWAASNALECLCCAMISTFLTNLFIFQKQY